MYGDLYKDRNNKLWIEIELDNAPEFEQVSDISREYYLPKGTLYDSTGSEFLSFDYRDELEKIGTGYELMKIGASVDFQYGYARKKSLERMIMNCVNQIETIKDLKKFDSKYHRLIRFLGEE